MKFGGASIDPTYEYCWTTDPMTSNTSEIVVDTTDEKWEYNALTRGGGNKVSYDELASALDDTAWLATYPHQMTAAGGSGSNPYMFLVLSDNTSGQNVGQDAIGMSGSRGASFPSSMECTGLAKNGAALAQGGGLSTSPEDNLRYFELNRISATTGSLTSFTDSDYSSEESTLSISGIVSGITGLDTIKICNFASGSGGTVTGYVGSCLKLYDGISEL